MVVFTTPLALEWAANQKVVESFSGLVSHTAVGDAVVIAPASANFISKMAHGQTDCAASAMVSAALGQRKGFSRAEYA